MNTYGDGSMENDPDLSSLSSLSHASSMGKEESSLREINDARLVQALNYLHDEGGDDSPARYMKCVSKIRNDLVQRLLHEGGDYDTILHRHLRAAVRKELNAFNEAVYYDPPMAQESSSSISESENDASSDHSPEDRPASASYALYRREEQLDGPVGEKDYKNLTLSDIKARLQPPTLPEEVEEEIKRWCTPEQIEKVVEEFKKYGEGEELSKDHTLRAFLDKLMLGMQGDATDIRHAVNASPTKLQASSVRSSSRSATSTIPASREKAPKAARDTITGGNTSLAKPESKANAPSPLARKIDRSRAISLMNSPRRQSGVSTAPPSAEITPIEATVLQQGSGNRKSNTSAKNASQTVNNSADVDAPKASSSKKTRRKRSIGEQAYTPEKKRQKSAAPSSLKKSGGAPLQTPERSVRFVAEDSDDTASDSTIAIRESEPRKLGRKRTPKSGTKASANGKSKASSSRTITGARKSLLVKDTPAKSGKKSSILPSKGSVKITKKDSKATAAGKAVRNTFAKKAAKNSVVEEGTKRRSTKSGATPRK